MSPIDNKFKVHTGQLLYRGLFFEETGADKTGVLYTLKREDHSGFPSLYKLYMETDDLTEYTFAITHLDGWEHWKNLCECTWFKPFIRRWREELDIRTRGRALNAVRDLANNADAKEAFQANKFLLNGEWRDKGQKHGRGRPSKEDIRSEAAKQASASRELNEEFERISGVVN